MHISMCRTRDVQPWISICQHKFWFAPPPFFLGGGLFSFFLYFLLFFFVATCIWYSFFAIGGSEEGVGGRGM